MCKRVLRKTERRLVTGNEGKQNVLKSSSDFRDLGLLWPFSVPFYVFLDWVIFLVILRDNVRSIFAFWSPSLKKYVVRIMEI